MKAVFITDLGDGAGLEIREVADPPPPSGSEVLLRVKAAGVNRADLIQKKGLYPPPPGFSPNIPGLEFAGEVAAVGPDVKGLSIGDRVFGITAGEGQAEYLTVDHSLVAKIPEDLSFSEAAAIPEAFVTAHDAVVTQAGLSRGETLLIHAVGSGVGLAALQIGKAIGATVLGTSRSDEKLQRCREFGLGKGIDTSIASDFTESVFSATGGRGSDVILDLVGASYFEQNLKCLAPKGRLMLVGLTGGRKAEFDLGVALAKRLTIKGTVLRSRSAEEKASAMKGFESDIVPLFASGTIRPNLDRVFSFDEVERAYSYLESNESFGKVVLEW